jgi:uncharacterized phage protein gp47/JayE
MEEIYQSMKNAVESGSGVNINNGGDMALRLYAVAAELHSLWMQTEWLQKQSFPQTATGGFLDSHAALRGLERRSGKCASGLIRFELSEVRAEEVSVPAGTVCLNGAGLEFLTNSDCVIPAGDTFCLARASAREAGGFGNVPEGGIYQMALAPIGVVRCYNPSAFSGGTDIESDKLLRQRVLDSFARLPNGSNAAYYESEALNTDGVAAARVLPRARGLGTVDLVIASEQGIPTQEQIDELQTRLEAEREICVDVLVTAPQTVPLEVSVAVAVEDGFDGDAVIANVASALNMFFDGRLLGRDLPLAKIGSVIYGVEGVFNYTISSPDADLSVSPYELPTAGAISVTGS